ncbi:acyltransferase [Candidatus Trichorickettsia mobilis]|uniref:acyltransferase n=1 Tax=Candidatus Trichorickettsia mobilis TaxID=1346319 RepID=UPI0029312A35|nr:acyltransferase [Candidatus Trichorickettsia mobilis]
MSVTTFEYTKIVGKENIEFGNNIIIDDFVFIYAKNKMKFSNFVHIASFATIIGVDYFEMQDFTAISIGCKVLTATDDFKSWGFGNSTINAKYRNVTKAPVILEKFSIVGANAVILPGVTIGEGVAVGAGSIVTKDLAPWGVYIGNKRVKERDKKGVFDTYEKFCQENNY